MKPKIQLPFLIVLLLFIPFTAAFAESGGQLSPEQAAYDVNYYNLDLSIDPEAKTISGSLLCRVEIVEAIDMLVLDLHDVYTIDSIWIKKNEGNFSMATFTHAIGMIEIMIPGAAEIGDMISVQIFYNGEPQIAISPPWGVGFVWEETPSGDHWIGIACEDEGGDLWWPCKDHPSDEPDSMSMSFTVPDPLVCVSNGRYLGNVVNGNGTTTFNWFISTPINNYNVSIYAADYDLIEDEYVSISGETIPFYFWVLPEVYNTAVNYMDVFLQEFNFLETICGPFPFGTDKHGWAHASYWGMEHQTIIAYGHNFSTNNWGYDYIHYHELAHEWWGNHITAANWADVWIHEGMATYTEALYVEYMSGFEDYITFMSNSRPPDNHANPLAPYGELTASQGFDLNPYSRGSAVMHTLRYHLGDDVFLNLFERWLYPDSTDYDNTNGRQCRILSTDDMKVQAEEVTGVDLDPFFDVFFREASYPDLMVVREWDQTTFTWETENNVLLDVNIPVLVNGLEQTVSMTAGQGTLNIFPTDVLVIDPDQWILMAVPNVITSVDDEFLQKPVGGLGQNYPNPFNGSTNINFTLAKSQLVTLEVFDMYGKIIATLVNEEKLAGKHEVSFEDNELKNGTYFYRMQTDDYTETRRFTYIK